MINAGMSRGPKPIHNNSRSFGIRADEKLHKKIERLLKKIKKAGIEPNKSDFTRFVLRNYAEDALEDYIDYIKDSYGG